MAETYPMPGTDLESDGRIAKTGRHVEGRYGRPLVVWRVLS